jgi:protein-tyrosine-phosphatase
MSTVLFICTGNLCRSPMAAGLLRQRLAESGMDSRHRVFSAGVWAVDGHPASEHAIAVMAERGVDISGHIAHTITSEDVTEADLILAMSREHEQMIRNTWPQYDWKLYRLSEMAGKRQDIKDPYGRPIEEYRACADVLEDFIERGFQKIVELV